MKGIFHSSTSGNRKKKAPPQITTSLKLSWDRKKKDSQLSWVFHVSFPHILMSMEQSMLTFLYTHWSHSISWTFSCFLCSKLQHLGVIKGHSSSLMGPRVIIFPTKYGPNPLFLGTVPIPDVPESPEENWLAWTTKTTHERWPNHGHNTGRLATWYWPHLPSGDDLYLFIP